LQRDESQRDRMVVSITPTWDANETWLIMAGVGLLAGFPIAYGILLPAFYLPLIIMLLSLGLRGVSFEFRIARGAHRRLWDAAFGVGSILAAAMQGLIVGGLIQGITVQGTTFAGSVWDAFRPFPVLVAATALAGYTVLGAGWLHLKGTGALKTFATSAIRRAVPASLALAAATSVVAPMVQPGVAAVWARMPTALVLAALAFVAAGAATWASAGRSRDAAPFAWALVMVATAVVGLCLVISPDVVPFRLTLWQAASATASHVFLLIGAAVVTPMVLAYSAFAYRVFRGKTPSTGAYE
jgi:cytochrome bd ubiquinol oxidase subunit II